MERAATSKRFRDEKVDPIFAKDFRTAFTIPLWNNKCLILKKLYMNNIAAIVHLEYGEKGPPRSSDEAHNLNFRLKSVLGQLMRITANLLEQLGLPLPLYALISASETPKTNEFFELLDNLTNDQDWSRGNFALVSVKEINGEMSRQLVRDLIIDVDLNKIETIEPIETEVFKNRLTEEVRSRNLTGDHEELISVLTNCLMDQSSPTSAVASWVENKLGNIEKSAKKKVNR